MAAAQRGPAGRELLARVRAEAARGWPAGLTVLSGDDLYHLDRAKRAIFGALVADTDDTYGRTVFGEAKVDLAAVVAAARSVGMFAPRRVVFVRELAALAGDDDSIRTLLEYAAKPPPHSHLVVRAPQLDARRKLHKALAEAGRLLAFELPEGEARITAALPVAGEIARERGIRLEAEALALLVDLTGGDLLRIEHELDKLAAWLEREGDAVRPDEVLEVASASGLASGWAAAAALTRRDRAATLLALRQSVGAGEAPLRILGTLAWRARALREAKGLAEARRSIREIVQATRAWRFEAELVEGLARYDRDELLALPAALLEADRALKSRALAAHAVLEGLADRVTGGRR